MLQISSRLSIPTHEIEMIPIRSQGAGGQNVNKVASAIHLRFNILTSSLSQQIKERLLQTNDHRINKDGEIIIKAQEYRSQEKNKEAALARLRHFIEQSTKVQKTRRPTKATKSSRQKRMDSKTRRGQTKQLRKKIQ